MCIVQVTVFELWTNIENVVKISQLKTPKKHPKFVNLNIYLSIIFKQILFVFGKIHFIFRQSELLLK